jgi:glycine dehydrogenase subunit 2
MSNWPLKTKLSLLQSNPGHEGFSLPENDVPEAPPPTHSAREGRLKLPELSELDVVRHFTRLSQLNFSIDGGMYPLGSCTMKYNPRVNELTSGMRGFSRLHPLTPDKFAQGALELMFHFENLLSEISGFSRVSLQPAAGAQGEYLGIKMMRACFESRGERRSKILIPQSAHGTNGASAAMCGYSVLPVRSTVSGLADLAQIEELTRGGDVAGIMITNPNTLGLFETDILKITQLIHDRGGLIYCDGANLNAMLGVTRPGDAGIDCMHFNMHKTFTTPHGGGGPGCGGLGVSKALVPFLPVPTVERNPSGAEDFILDSNRPQSVGKIKDHYGHFLMMVRAYTYIRELGAEGIQKAGRDAILLANYIRMRLKDHYDIAFDRTCMHEVVFTDKRQQKNGVKTLDIAKRLIDEGFHPPTIYFPLIVQGALMIEPTETESLRNVEKFCETMIQIAKEAQEENAFEKHFKDRPHHVAYGRVNETLAAKQLKLTWKDLESEDRL